MMSFLLVLAGIWAVFTLVRESQRRCQETTRDLRWSCHYQRKGQRIRPGRSA